MVAWSQGERRHWQDRNKQAAQEFSFQEGNNPLLDLCITAPTIAITHIMKVYAMLPITHLLAAKRMGLPDHLAPNTPGVHALWQQNSTAMHTTK